MSSILSINSNKAMNYLLKTVLSKNYNLIAVPDVFYGQQELKRQKNIELIIIDIDYNMQTNLDFIQHLKTSWLYQRPVIVLSSENNQETTERLIEANVHDILIKPFNPNDLKKSIGELLPVSTLA